jgi:anaerobic selenocysteine-containing dehydrogenase
LLTYNRAAIPPLGESKSNWEVMGLLAREMGYQEPWLHQSADEVIDEVLAATASNNPLLEGVTLERLKQEGPQPLRLPPGPPFAGGRFPTPSGKVELYCQRLADEGADPLPGRFDFAAGEADNGYDPALALRLVSGAAHHFVSSTFANQPGLVRHEGSPFIEIHPADAATRGIYQGDNVVVENGRGSVRLRAVVTDAIRPGVVASPKGRWASLDGGSNINWTTSDELADIAGQSTFHSTRVWLRRD